MVGGHAIVTFLADPKARDYSVWLCTSCWRCQEACPAGVDIYELMMQERRREPSPAGYRAAFESLLACGLALGISQEELDQMRAAWGLEPARLPCEDLAIALLSTDSGMK
jgi:heterodisulfide reductase subunit C